MAITLHRSVESDLAAAFRYYLGEVGKGVAGRYLSEFERIIQLLEANPGLGAPTAGDRRCFPFSGFPYSLLYRETAIGIRVLVVRHQKRSPAFGDARR